MTQLHLVADIYLAAFYSYVAVFYTVLIKSRSAKASSCQMVHPGQPFRLHWWNHLVFRVMRILIWGFCVSRLFIPAVDTLAVLFPASGLGWLRASGLLILTLGFALAVSGNFSLRSAWRSGIDPSAPEGLKRDGLYAISRNPTYIGVALGQIGFFLSIPSAFTLFCLIVGLISLQIQIHLEEAHLRQRFKDLYTEYCRLVPRWF